MKHKFFSIIALLLSISISVQATLDQRKLEPGDGGSIDYVNSCPGPQGSRQSQVVACSDFWYGESQKSGCCQGGGLCFNMNPCQNGSSFRCGNAGWCSASLQ